MIMAERREKPEEKAERLFKEAFDDLTVKKAFKRSGGRCECTNTSCGHTGQCSARFAFDDRATSDDESGWQAHHIKAQADGGSDAGSNGRILCVPCHKNTESFGRQS